MKKQYIFLFLIIILIPLAVLASIDTTTNIPSSARMKVNLTGVDYISNRTSDAVLDDGGNLTLIDPNALLGKPNGKAEITLSADHLISEPIPVVIPAGGASLDFNPKYAGIIVPLSIASTSNATSVAVKVTGGNGSPATYSSLLSKDKGEDHITVLVTAEIPHKVTVTDVWNASSTVIDVPALTWNDVYTLDPIIVVGKNFDNPDDARMMFSCESKVSTAEKYACYRKYIRDDAYAKKNPMRCFDMSKYIGSYDIYLSADCIEYVDPAKKLVFDTASPKLVEIKGDMASNTLDNIKGTLASFYNEPKYCETIVGVSAKNSCYVKYITNDAKAKKDPLRCLDMAKYIGSYDISLSYSCVLQVDSAKKMVFEAASSKITQITSDLTSYTLDRIKRTFAEFYNEPRYCDLIVDAASKRSCYNRLGVVPPTSIPKVATTTPSAVISIGVTATSTATSTKVATTSVSVPSSPVSSGGGYSGGVSSGSGSGASAPKTTVTVSAVGVNKVYDGSTSASANLSVSGINGDDKVNVAYDSAVFSDANVGNGKTINISGIHITGGLNSGNYVLGNTTAVTAANITPKPETVTLSNLSPTYDGTPKAATANTSPDTVTVNIVYSGPGGAPTNIGSYSVTATVSNPNYSGSATGTLSIVDRTPPVIAAVSDIIATSSLSNGRTIDYTAPTTLDDVDGAGVATCVPASGSWFNIGTTVVDCSATDVAGNKSDSKFNVIITLVP